MEQTNQQDLFSAQPQVEEVKGTGEEHSQKEQDTTPAPETGVPIKFNHVRKTLSVSEAAVLAQKGLQAEGFLPKLQFLAALEQKSVAQLVDHLYTIEQEKTRAAYLQKVQDPDLAEQLLQGRNQRVGKAYEALQATLQTEAEKQAAKAQKAQLEQLQKEVPKLTALPAEVQKIAEQEGVTLFDAYLRFCWQESKRIAAAEAQEAMALARSAGSQKSTVGQGSEFSAMLRGVWAR